MRSLSEAASIFNEIKKKEKSVTSTRVEFIGTPFSMNIYTFMGVIMSLNYIHKYRIVIKYRFDTTFERTVPNEIDYCNYKTF